MANHVPKADQHWLADDYIIRLTPLEAGALMALVAAAKGRGEGSFEVNVPLPGTNGDYVTMPMIDRLIGKLEEEYHRHQ